MQLWPGKSEMVVSNLPSQEVFRRLHLAVKPADFQSYQNRALDYTPEDIFLFNGKVSDTGFAISQMVQKPDNFLPLIKGKVEHTSSGSLIYVKYVLFPSVKFFLGFWFMLMLLFSMISYVQGENMLTVFLPIILLVASFWVVLSRFNSAYEKSRKELVRLIG
jgi:type IV secretory pathway TrbL component